MSPNVPVSSEQFATVASRQGLLQLCYQTFGDPSAEPLLLVMGLGGPMIWWDESFCEELAQRGFFVIRFDNRDTGRSSRVSGRVGRMDLIRAFLGRPVTPPYTLVDLADDAFALLDYLGIARAHVAGVSMGGMIVQTMTTARPERILSMTSISSTLGRRTVGWVDPRILPHLIGRRGKDRTAYVRSSARLWKFISSPGFPFDTEGIDRRAGDTFDRGVSVSGLMRQMLAITTQPDRTTELSRLSIPTLVIHGDADRMVHLTGGRATHRAVADSKLVVIERMGHDLPPELHARLADEIRAVADRATA